jgi:hypothetical protein
LIEPAGNNCLFRQATGFLRQNNKNHLRDFFGSTRVARFSQGGGINHIDMTRHQCCERFIGIPMDVLLQ